MNEWMNECMNEWSNDESENEWLDERWSECVNVWMNELMNEWLIEWVNEWLNGWMNVWMNDGWMNVWIGSGRPHSTVRPPPTLVGGGWSGFGGHQFQEPKATKQGKWRLFFKSYDVLNQPSLQRSHRALEFALRTSHNSNANNSSLLLCYHVRVEFNVPLGLLTFDALDASSHNLFADVALRGKPYAKFVH